jgi:hypothetical protein
MTLQGIAKNLEALVKLAIANQSTACNQGQRKTFGMLEMQGLEDRHQRLGGNLVDVDSRQLQQGTNAVPRIGLDSVDPHPKLMGLLGPPLQVQEIKQCPARLWHGRVDLKCLDPLFFSQIIPFLEMVGLALAKPDDRGLSGCIGPNAAKVVKRSIGLWIRPVQSELSHEQIGARMVRKDPQELA